MPSYRLLCPTRLYSIHFAYAVIYINFDKIIFSSYMSHIILNHSEKTKYTWNPRIPLPVWHITFQINTFTLVYRLIQCNYRGNIQKMPSFEWFQLTNLTWDFPWRVGIWICNNSAKSSQVWEDSDRNIYFIYH